MLTRPWAYKSYGSYNELTFNPAGPVFSGTGKLNPFGVPAIREAMNYLIDRTYIAEEIMGGPGHAPLGCRSTSPPPTTSALLTWPASSS